MEGRLLRCDSLLVESNIILFVSEISFSLSALSLEGLGSLIATVLVDSFTLKMPVTLRTASKALSKSHTHHTPRQHHQHVPFSLEAEGQVIFRLELTCVTHLRMLHNTNVSTYRET